MIDQNIINMEKLIIKIEGDFVFLSLGEYSTVKKIKKETFFNDMRGLISKYNQKI